MDKKKYFYHDTLAFWFLLETLNHFVEATAPAPAPRMGLCGLDFLSLIVILSLAESLLEPGVVATQ